ncbi:hypothetical protein HMPREF1870_01204, partial [Bacteroidales bacterium KA00344]
MLHIIQVRNVLVSPDIFTEKFCCDLDACKGACCIIGDAGAPVTLDEIDSIEANLDAVWEDLSVSAQSVIDKQGVAYSDDEGDLVTSIVNGKDCVFTCYQDLEDMDDGHTIKNCCLCAFERAYRRGTTQWCKPISCALYPIREKQFADGTVGLNYHRWEICEAAVTKGKQLDMPVYMFLKEPLIRRFGAEWYDDLCGIAEQLINENEEIT